MKATRILLALCFILLSVCPTVTLAGSPTHMAYLKVETSKPIEFPEPLGGCLYGIMRRGSALMMEGRLEDNSVKHIDEKRVPIPYYTDNSSLVKFEGWDVDPYTYDYSKMDKDVTFTARFADVTQDGKLNTADAVVLLRYCAGTAELPKK